MEAIERRSESPLSKNRSSSRLSNISSQEFSDDSDTALIEHVKAKKRGRPKKQKEKENGNFHPDENGTDEQYHANGTYSDHEKPDEDDHSKLNSSFENNREPPQIIVMEISRDNSEIDTENDGEMIDLQIEEADEPVDVDESTSEKIVIISNDIEHDEIQTGETVEISVTEIHEEKEGSPDVETKSCVSEQDVQDNFDNNKILNDTDGGDDRWSVTVNIDSTDQKDLLENQSEKETETEPEVANTSFTNKISNLLGSWSPIRKDAEEVPVYYPRISARPGLKSGTPDRNLAGPSKEPVTPALGRFLDDSFRVKSEPAKFNRTNEEKSKLRKFTGKRCLNADEEAEEENEGGFLSRLSFRKRRKLNDSTESGSGWFSSVLRSPFKKRQVVDSEAVPVSPSKFSWLLTPFYGFGKKKIEDLNASNVSDVSSAEIAVEEESVKDTITDAAAPTTTTPPADVIKTDDKPIENKETGGCFIM